MEDARLLSMLEGLADRLGVPVTYAPLATEEFGAQGGTCVIRGRREIILERTLSIRQKARLLAEALAQTDLESVFLLPAVRDALIAGRPVVDQADSAARAGVDA
jgi:hypothetical protein